MNQITLNAQPQLPHLKIQFPDLGLSDIEKFILQKLRQRHDNIDGMPSYACALIIKKYHDRPFECLNAPQTHHQLPLTLFVHTDNKNRLVLSHEKTNKTLYSYQTHQNLNQSRHSTQAHNIIQYMLEHAIKETKSTLSNSALLYFKNLLLGETP